ncbi:MAG: translation elongation factor Ts [Candidatus Liptonbacteria bacterium]|nr:translation elongation factor Ts [Candidatus Liptonbacteria bacterium]
MSIDAVNVQKLRDLCGAGVMECKRALLEADGDFDRAAQIIKEKGLNKFEKRAGRETGAGLIHSYVHAGKIGVILDLRAETDFVVRSDPFKGLAHELAMQIAASAPANVEELLKQPYIKDESRMVQDLIKEVVAQVGENIRVNNFSRLEV